MNPMNAASQNTGSVAIHLFLYGAIEGTVYERLETAHLVLLFNQAAFCLLGRMLFVWVLVRVTSFTTYLTVTVAPFGLYSPVYQEHYLPRHFSLLPV